MSDSNRRYDIDWLRVLATFTIFLFHCARFFDEEDWHIKNNQLDLGMSIFVGIVSQWLMPLFFVLSAQSAYYALSHRTDKQYLQERFQRLVIPLLFGIFVLIPPQVYIERLSHSQFSDSFIQFFPHYFDGFYAFGGNFAWMGLHLWYLEILFIFSLLTLPLFRYLRRETVVHKIAQTANFFVQPGVIFLLAIPLSFAELLVNLQPDGIGRRDFGGWSLLVWTAPDYTILLLSHLLSNAIKFSPTPTIVMLTATLIDSASPFVLFQVRDRGIGIPPQQLEQIFDCFYQIDLSDSRPYQGLGLGLALAEQIIQQQSGQLWAESTLGVGSTFYFTLPAYPPPLHWWVEIHTTTPQCTYYFGPFETALEASSLQSGYLEDLRQEQAQVMTVKIKQCQPQRLTICEELSLSF